ncbi:MAG: ECF transporter S component [Candidatus Eremiobacterota bacterium]
MQRYQTTALMLAVTLFLGITRTGFLQVPDTVGRAFTILHLPAILAGVFDGPLAGGAVGLTFGVIALFLYPPPDPVMHLLPRVLIGVVAGGLFQLVRRLAARSPARNSLAALVAALGGSLTNTLGVSLISVLRGSYALPDILPVAVFHGSVEAILAVLFTVPPVVLLYSRKQRR